MTLPTIPQFEYDPAEAVRLDACLSLWSDPLVPLKAWHDEGSLPFLHLPARRDDLAVVTELATAWRNEFSDLVLLGTGGSSLGAKALYALVHQGLGQVAEGLRLHVLENVDPAPITALMERLDPAKTQVLSVSKSGNTAETLAQTLLFMDWFRSQLSEAAFSRHFTVLTEAKASALSRLAERFGVTQLAHDPHIGGRFSVLSIVGLLPALALGIDAEAIRAGANAVLAPALAGDRSHAALKGAAWALHHQLAGRNLAVLLPYADQLTDFGLWYRQLWAESLGKDGLGSTPIRAMGTVDQHSQLQLYLDGPADKTFSFIALDARGQGPNIPSDLGDDSLSYLTGHRLGDLLYAEARASADTLIHKGHPVRWMTLERMDAYTLGGLLMHFMLETIFTAHYSGVNAFDQPAVEAIKIRTREVL